MMEHESTAPTNPLERQQAALGYIVQAMMKEDLTLADVETAYVAAAQEKPDTPHETVDEPPESAFLDNDHKIEPESSEREKK